MEIKIREFADHDLMDAVEIWNQVVEDGVAFPQVNLLYARDGLDFFRSQSYTGLACDEAGRILGLYILHPNNVGRCGHICNASYAVRRDARGMHIGELLVSHSLEQGKLFGFKIMQFNAVVKANLAALHLYEKLGFVKLGEIPGGFLMKDGHFEDIVLFHHLL